MTSNLVGSFICLQLTRIFYILYPYSKTQIFSEQKFEFWSYNVLLSITNNLYLKQFYQLSLQNRLPTFYIVVAYCKLKKKLHNFFHTGILRRQQLWARRGPREPVLQQQGAEGRWASGCTAQLPEGSGTGGRRQGGVGVQSPQADD